MARFSVLLTSVTLAAFAGACGSGATTAPRPPAPVNQETRRAPRTREPPPLIAPPPAYGNKIVLAASDGAKRF